MFLKNVKELAKNRLWLIGTDRNSILKNEQKNKHLKMAEKAKQLHGVVKAWGGTMGSTTYANSAWVEKICPLQIMKSVTKEMNVLEVKFPIF